MTFRILDRLPEDERTPAEAAEESNFGPTAYELKDDFQEGLKEAVQNGMTRLAMEYVVRFFDAAVLASELQTQAIETLENELAETREELETLKSKAKTSSSSSRSSSKSRTTASASAGADDDDE